MPPRTSSPMRCNSYDVFYCLLRIQYRISHIIVPQEVIDAPKNMGPDALLRQTAKQARHREVRREWCCCAECVKCGNATATCVHS